MLNSNYREINMPALRELYAGETRLRAVVDCVLDGALGDFEVDCADRPAVARLRLGCYAVFAGDPTLPAAVALLANTTPPIELIVPRTRAWEAQLQAVHGQRLQERPMQAYTAAGIDSEHLLGLAAAVPTGIELRRLDAALAVMLDSSLRPNGMEVIGNPLDFAQRSGGMGAVADGVLVCAATNYAYTADAIELAIATSADFRGRGLATCVAASWTLHCLQSGITPHWNAANPISQRLALRLGYTPSEIVEVQFISPASV